jgi:hypothetical protein
MINELTLVSWISYSEEENAVLLHVEIEVDGNLIVNFKQRGTTLSLPNLIASQSLDGEWYILTCTCGELWCHGINQSIFVRHENQSVYWTVNTDPILIYRFDYLKYCNAIQVGINHIRELLLEEPNIEMDTPIYRYFYPHKD